jgi:hypothetical protein
LDGLCALGARIVPVSAADHKKITHAAKDFNNSNMELESMFRKNLFLGVLSACAVPPPIPGCFASPGRVN